jgi:hypothetical protein
VSISEVPKPKEHMDKTVIKLLKLMKKSYTPNLSTVGFIYEVLTNLQSNRRNLLFNFSSFERMVMREDEGYALGR